MIPPLNRHRPDNPPSAPPAFHARDPLRVAEHLAARLCHDISGALGTVTNAIELAAEDPASTQEALGLAVEASGVLTLRLRLLRGAFAGGAEAMDIAALLSLAKALPSGHRMRVDASAVAADVQFSPPAVRLMLNLFLLAAESLPAGGRLALAGHPARDIVAAIEGPQAAWPAGLASWLVDEEAAWLSVGDARTLVGPLLALIAREQGMRVSFLLPIGSSPGRDLPALLLGFSGE